MTRHAMATFAEDGMQRVLELARRHLDMDLAFVAEFTEGRQVYRGIDGDGASFGCAVGDGPPLRATYCRLMVADQIPNAVPDAVAHPLLRELPATRQAEIGAYVGVPLRLPDGSLYGSLCCLSHARASVDQRDARFLAMLGELLAADLQAERDRLGERDRFGELIEHGRLEVALQPIVDLSSGRALGVEALSRFPAGFGPPDAVFAAAHQAGLGLALERLAAVRAYEALSLLAPDQYLALNLTPGAAMALAEESRTMPDAPYHRIVLEITEHAAVQNYAALRERLAHARAQGLRLAIDDAGAGYASLHHIVELRPDVIKIDRSLIHGMSADRARRSVVKALIALARDLGAAVVAEGVERQADLVAGRKLGICAAQGYLLGRPTTDRAQLVAWVTRPWPVLRAS